MGSLGIHSDEHKTENTSLLEFERTIRFIDGRYEVGLLWKSNKDTLLNNENIAMNRSRHQMGQLNKTPELKERYNAVLTVVRESSLTKKNRPVFDDTATGYNHVSLNDCLESGPSLVPELTWVLMHFRRLKFALTADISKAFLHGF